MSGALALNSVEYGDGSPPLVILHGLFGSARNWHSPARALAGERKVHAVDLRNHGSSPRAATMSYAEMAQDVDRFLRDRALAGAHLMGHSMGGKVAMQLALNAPALIDALIVVDIAPRAYPPHHDDVLDALNSLDLSRHQDRKSVDQALAAAIEDAALRQFLLTNLERRDGCLGWQIHLPAITADYDAIAAAPQGAIPFDKPTLFVKGARSNYLRPEDRAEIERLFPNAVAKVIADAGHWPHAEKPRLFASIVASFLNELA